MAAKVTFKSMDYFKFRKYIIDKDDASSCSKEVTALCACLQTLNMRDDEFADGDGEWTRLEEVFANYKQILSFKKVETVDVRLKSGWWGDQKSGLSVGKVKPAMLKEMLLSKCRDWYGRHGDAESEGLEKAIDGPGVYVFKHKEKGCFQKALRCEDNIFARCAEFFKSTFDGTTYTPLSSLLVVSLVSDWDFYFVRAEENSELLKVVENDTILKHDSLWPHGLNLTLSIETPFDVRQFRHSCVRHNWPPERICRPSKVQAIDSGRLKLDQQRLKSQPPTLRSPIKNAVSPISPPTRPNSARPNSTGNTVSNLTSNISKSPTGPRPSTAHCRQQRSDDRPTNGVSRKDSSRQETNSTKPKRASRSFKKSINDLQGIGKNEVKSTSSQKVNGSLEQNISPVAITKQRIQEKPDDFKTSKNEISKNDNNNSYSDKIEDGDTKKDEIKNHDNKEDEQDDDEFFEEKPIKRSGTFTLSDDEDDNQATSSNECTLTSRAVMAAKKITSNK